MLDGAVDPVLGIIIEVNGIRRTSIYKQQPGSGVIVVTYGCGIAVVNNRLGGKITVVVIGKEQCLRRSALRGDRPGKKFTLTVWPLINDCTWWLCASRNCDPQESSDIKK